jgi:hypothetical protein
MPTRTFCVWGLTAAFGLASTPSAADTLRLAGTIGGVNVCAADNNVACGFGIQLTDIDANPGSLSIGETTIGAINFKGSVQLATPGPANRVLSSSFLTLRNTTGAPVSATIAVGATGFLGVVNGAVTSGSGTFANAGGATTTLTWCHDSTNSQGAELPNDCPGTVDTFSFSVPAGVPVESFAHTAGPFAVTASALFSMTMKVEFTLPAGGQFVSRGQVMEAVDVPVVDCTVAQQSLWPPNHDLVNVGLTASAQTSTGPLPVTINVFSNEDDEENTGDGNFSPDATSPPLRLRAERKGNGDGRIYLIRASATGPSGVAGFGCCTAVVPQMPNAAGLSAVLTRADAAEAACDAGGTVPPGFVAVGDGPVIGPKQ